MYDSGSCPQREGTYPLFSPPPSNWLERSCREPDVGSHLGPCCQDNTLGTAEQQDRRPLRGCSVSPGHTQTVTQGRNKHLFYLNSLLLWVCLTGPEVTNSGSHLCFTFPSSLPTLFFQVQHFPKLCRRLLPNCGLLEVSGCVGVNTKKMLYEKQECFLDATFAFILCLILLCLILIVSPFGGRDSFGGWNVHKRICMYAQ